MFEGVEQWCVWLLDPVLGWLLPLPSDIRFIVLSVFLSMLLVLMRRLTTNQDLLRRVARDRRRLLALTKLARSQGNRADVLRYRKTRSMIAIRILKVELVPLLVLVIPVTTVAIWCQARLNYSPLLVDQPIRVHVYAPVSTIGDAIHIVPQDGLTVEGAIRRIDPNPSEDETVHIGTADWTIRVHRAGEYGLLFRHRQVSIGHEISVGTNHYLRPFVHGQEEGWSTYVELKPIKLFGVIGGIDRLGIPSWLVGCLILIVPLYCALKRLLRVY
ncbi:MAG: hypothetical protein JXA82_09295 [Sedimentisphaerales bacterium]|nr:hypothetical protein [Sedimentisphaerales bacterium]